MCITDLNSTNGTVVNGQELSPMDNIEVEVGSEVIFGEFGHNSSLVSLGTTVEQGGVRWLSMAGAGLGCMWGSEVSFGEWQHNSGPARRAVAGRWLGHMGVGVCGAAKLCVVSVDASLERGVLACEA